MRPEVQEHLIIGMRRQDKLSSIRQASFGYQAVAVEGDFGWVLFGLGLVLYFQTHYSRHTGALSYPFSTSRLLSGALGFKIWSQYKLANREIGT